MICHIGLRQNVREEFQKKRQHNFGQVGVGETENTSFSSSPLGPSTMASFILHYPTFLLVLLGQFLH